MTPIQLLETLRSVGLHLDVTDSDRIHVRPLELLTSERRKAILAAKPALLSLLLLESRIRAMAGRWGYSAEDLSEALDAAHINPAGWRLVVEADERSVASAERAGLAWPP